MRKQLCSVLLAVAAASVAISGVAQAEEAKRVHNGMQILFHPDHPEAFCTIGAVGTDDYGRKIAISAGHCIRDAAYADRELLDDIQPIWDRNDLAAGAIGHVRYFKDPEGAGNGHVSKDYMIIELVPSVRLSSTGTHMKQTGELKVPGGTPSPNATTSPVLDSERLLGTAWFNNNELVVSGQLGIWYGRVTSNAGGIYQSWAKHQGGDSGGPTIWHVPGSAYPSEANGFKAEGPWAGITKGLSFPSLPIYIYTSSANILADLRARDAATPADVYGAGFEVTTNP
ncbi:hypothetical protein GCM10027589_06080 [Actinocorallia lasiicapitis]